MIRFSFECNGETRTFDFDAKQHAVSLMHIMGYKDVEPEDIKKIEILS